MGLFNDFINGLYHWWTGTDKPDKNAKDQAPPRRYPKDVVPNEIVVIEWWKIQGKIGEALCINNDPENKKMLLGLHWGNPSDTLLEKERIILNYNSSELANFHLLNPVQRLVRKKKDGQKVDDTDIAALQSLMNKAMDNNEWEKVDEYQKKIDALTKK